MRDRALKAGLMCLSIGAACLLGGCYERVTQARGLGADQYAVSEPYQENSQLDDWLFGKQEKPKTRGSSLNNR